MTVLSYETARERAARGAALLDQKSPGWWRTLVPESIEMQYNDRCVLGSINRDVGYLGLVRKLEISHELKNVNGTVVWYGFDITLNECDDGNSPSFARLTDAWRNLIAARQTEVGLR